MHPSKVLPFLYTHARDNGENSHTRRKRIYECRIMIRANSVLSKLILLHTPDPELLALAEVMDVGVHRRSFAAFRLQMLEQLSGSSFDTLYHDSQL